MNLRYSKAYFVLIILVTLSMLGVVHAEKWYVHVLKGNDGYNGLYSLPIDGVKGPKQTINDAIRAASANDTIYVAYANGNEYQPVNIDTTDDKDMYFSPYQGESDAPVVQKWETIRRHTFLGEFLIDEHLKIWGGGEFVNAYNLILASGSQIMRMDGTFDSSPQFSGWCNLTYALSGDTIVSGPEHPVVNAPFIDKNGNPFDPTSSSGHRFLDVNGGDFPINNLTIETGTTYQLPALANESGGGFVDSAQVKGIRGDWHNKGPVILQDTLVVWSRDQHTVEADFEYTSGGALYFRMEGGSGGYTVVVDGDYKLPNIVASRFISTGMDSLQLKTDKSIGKVTNKSRWIKVKIPHSGTDGNEIYGLSNEERGEIVVSWLAAAPRDVYIANNTTSEMNGGEIFFRNDGKVVLNGLNLVNGLVKFNPATNDSAVIIKSSPAKFLGGDFSMGPNSGTRTLSIQSDTTIFGTDSFGSSTVTDFNHTDMDAVTLLFNGGINQYIFGRQKAALWFGPLTINNGNNEVVFIGDDFRGQLRVLDDVHFQTGDITLSDFHLIVGSDTPPYMANGTFTNDAGYKSLNLGHVEMNGNASPQFVTGDGEFANIAFNNDANAGGLDIFLGDTLRCTEHMYLVKGQVDNSGPAYIIFNMDETTGVQPTIVRNRGELAALPLFDDSGDTTRVNVAYIGKDKESGYEIPSDGSHLNDLSVETTNSLTAPGRGTIYLSRDATVHGSLNVNEDQALIIATGTYLQMMGSNATIYGDLANEHTPIVPIRESAQEQSVQAENALATPTPPLYIDRGIFVLSRPSGTTINCLSSAPGDDPGGLPDTYVSALSQGNVIYDAPALYTEYFMNDNLIAGDTSAVRGSLSFQNNPAGSISSLAIRFAPSSQSHIENIFMGSGANLTLLSNMNQGGYLRHVADAAINVSDFVYWFMSGTKQHNFQGGSSTLGDEGYLLFDHPSTVRLGLERIGGNDPDIDADVVVNLDNAANKLELRPVGTPGDLYLDGDFTLIQGTIRLFRELHLRGKHFNFHEDGSVIGADTLFLASLTPPMEMMIEDSPSLNHLTVLEDVNLSGAQANPALDVNGWFRHGDGLLNFGAIDITVNGHYHRDDGTYAATTGYLVINTNTFRQGATAFTIPNLSLIYNGNFTATEDADFTVTQRFDLRIGDGHQFNHDGKLAMSNGVTFTFEDGTFDDPPDYKGTIRLNLVCDSDHPISDEIWPAAPTTLVTTVNDSATAASVDMVLPGSRTVNDTMNYYRGNVQVPDGNVFTVANDAVIEVVDGTLELLGTASTNYGSGIWVYYYNNGTDRVTGPELPPEVERLEFTRYRNIANKYTQVMTPVVVSGLNSLHVKNNVETFGKITTMGDVYFANESNAFNLATDPKCKFHAPLEFAGPNAQMLHVPSAGMDLTGGGVANANLRVAKTNSDSMVTLQGGDIETGVIFFSNGLLATQDDNAFVIPAPPDGQGFDRSDVGDDDLSHVVGNVRKGMVNTGNLATSTFQRSEFPVGNRFAYRPAVITFQPIGAQPTIPSGIELTVKHVSESPQGDVGLPIENGIEANRDIGGYPDFYWDIRANGTYSQSYFDLELIADGFTEYQDVEDPAYHSSSR
ncbi:MAG: hypothetical protein U5R06_19615 [candidate division KSB1 bacterium]|nr:hypothetical protein [candidate division KSB1 bacterium]